ncbi:MAG TPA: NAD+ synthase, partial [Acidimicrobiia bacterium]|nr:NAD+ synthase [Acidimicrobiia bacterium]
MPVKVAAAQINLRVGDISGNETRIAEAISWAAARGADILLLPELALCGYPPEDLVLRDDFVEANLSALQRLAPLATEVSVVVGFVDRARPRPNDDSQPRTVANAAAVLSGGQILGVYHKVLLPNYGVFDEDRYFVVGSEPSKIWDLGGLRVGVSVCEDIWVPD